MKKLKLYCTLIHFLFTSSMANIAPVQPGISIFPQIIDGTGAEIEQEVLNFARDVYKSSVFDWSDYSGLQSVKSDAAVIVAIPDVCFVPEVIHHEKRSYGETHYCHFYYPKVSENNYTFVVFQMPFNWQGDWHRLYWIQQDVFQNIIISSNTTDASNESFEEKLTAYKIGPIGETEDGWQKPFLLKTKKGDTMVGVISEHPAYMLSTWTVYAPLEKDKLHVFKIHFLPDIENQKFFLKEGSMEKIITLLDEILGVDHHQGTYRPISILRDNVNKILINLARRPWALSKIQPYNTNEEIEAGLQRKISVRKSYKKLKTLYLSAQKELTDYYISTFGYEKVEAKRLAEKNLDLFYRSHFTFKKKG